MLLKIKLYIISLVFLFILIIANQIPICIGPDCNFLSVKQLFLKWPPILIFCFLGLIASVIFFREFKYKIVEGAAIPPEKITSIEDLNYENLTFLATYIIPLVCFDLDYHLTEERNFIMLILVLILIGWIYIKTNIFYTNPTLAILNFKIYRIATEKRSNIIIISKEQVSNNDLVYLNKMDDKIFYASKYEAK